MSVVSKVMAIIKDAAGDPAEWSRHEHAIVDIAREADGKIEQVCDAVQEAHSALDDALGDSDVTHLEDGDLRNEYPVQWAAQRLAAIITDLKE